MKHLLSLGLLAGLALAACKSDKTTGPGAAAGTFTGTLAAGTESGVLTITVSSTAALMSSRAQFDVQGAAASPVSVTGTIKLKGGTTITLQGTFDATRTPQLQVASVPAAYTLSGTFSGGQFYGTYTGPAGNGSFVALSTQSGAVKVFCGIYSGGATGVWNLALGSDNTTLTGVAVEPSSTTRLSGTLMGTGLNVHSPDDPSLLATGTLDPTTGAGSGNWSVTGKSGTWTASTSGCQ